jgi:hypothetical protein
MSTLDALPAGRFEAPADFVEAIRPDDLVYFCCNVGDADAQLLLLPCRAPDQQRRAVVVDAGTSGKIDRLLEVCAQRGLLPTDPDTGDLASDAIALVVATHPHSDHIGGMPRLLRRFGPSVVEYWDSGYWHPIGAFHSTMTEIEKLSRLVYAQPTSGTRRWIHQTRITVLAPAIHLRNRYDSYGVEINNASVTLRFDYPSARVLQRDGERRLIGRDNTVSLILGGDAQTESWAHVATDFPQLHSSGNAAARAIRAAGGVDHLRADVLKVSHHASKHGVNLELVSRIAPKLTLVSCSDHSPQHHFPHQVAQDLVREALQPTGGVGRPRSADWDLGLFYTADRDDDDPPRPLGTIALRLRPRLRELWRLGDGPSDVGFDLSNARRWADMA